jgi:hypothetical protein
VWRRNHGAATERDIQLDEGVVAKYERNGRVFATGQEAMHHLDVFGVETRTPFTIAMVSPNLR